jgi:hypothetical protein
MELNLSPLCWKTNVPHTEVLAARRKCNGPGVSVDHGRKG